MHTSSQKNRAQGRSPPTQTIASQSIDPAKLSVVLNRRFGQKAYRVEMRHNMFSIFARGRLTQEEIDQCSYGPHGLKRMF
ncbi:hypothetical protein RB213_012339 [Colletotrichum asianum]